MDHRVLIDAVAERVLKEIRRLTIEGKLEEIGGRFGFTPRRRWFLKGLRAAVLAFWAAGIENIFIDGSFCTEKPEPR
jgi:hypothetical protein